MGLYQVLRSIGLSLGSALAAAVLIAYTDAGHIYPTYQGFPGHAAHRQRSVHDDGRSELPAPRQDLGAPSAPTKEVEKLMEEEAEVEGAGLMLADERLLTESGE